MKVTIANNILCREHVLD